MKILSIKGLITIGLCTALFSCSDDKNAAKQYGDTMVDSLKTTKNAEKKINVSMVRKSIQEYQAANGRYPADLKEVTAFNGIELESDRYDYNPETGTLTEKP